MFKKFLFGCCFFTSMDSATRPNISTVRLWFSVNSRFSNEIVNAYRCKSYSTTVSFCSKKRRCELTIRWEYCAVHTEAARCKINNNPIAIRWMQTMDSMLFATNNSLPVTHTNWIVPNRLNRKPSSTANRPNNRKTTAPKEEIKTANSNNATDLKGRRD